MEYLSISSKSSFLRTVNTVFCLCWNCSFYCEWCNTVFSSVEAFYSYSIPLLALFCLLAPTGLPFPIFSTVGIFLLWWDCNTMFLSLSTVHRPPTLVRFTFLFLVLLAPVSSDRGCSSSPVLVLSVWCLPTLAMASLRLSPQYVSCIDTSRKSTNPH